MASIGRSIPDGGSSPFQIYAGILAARTATRSIVGGFESSSGAFSLSTAATRPVKCAFLSASTNARPPRRKVSTSASLPGLASNLQRLDSERGGGLSHRALLHRVHSFVRKRSGHGHLWPRCLRRSIDEPVRLSVVSAIPSLPNGQSRRSREVLC